jgi:hypothetical protein
MTPLGQKPTCAAMVHQPLADVRDWCMRPWTTLAIGRKPSTLEYNSLFPIPYSLFPIPYSLFPIPYFLFPCPIPYSLFPIPYSLFPFPYSLFPVVYILNPTPSPRQRLPPLDCRARGPGADPPALSFQAQAGLWPTRTQTRTRPRAPTAGRPTTQPP